MLQGTEIQSAIPARLDALPWSRWHWRVVIALGVSWLLDGLEVTVVGSLGPALQRPDTLALYFGGALLLGMVFHAQIDWVVNELTNLGLRALLVVGTLLALYIAYKWWDRMRFVKTLRSGRIAVDELSAMMSRGDSPLVLDVRSRAHRLLDARRIPGARAIDLDDLEKTLAEVPRDREVVVYCACPNEVTAVRVAMALRAKGFLRVRPLAGGVEAWVEAGLQVEVT